MKKWTLLLLVLAGCFALFAKHDGWYVNELTRNYATPHLEWAKGSAPLKVLFLTPRIGARDVVELAQRLPMDYTAFVAYNRNALHIESVYEAALTGTGRYEKEQEIRTKAEKKYDLIVVANAPFTSLPSDAQFQLLQQVREGAGMIIVSQKLPFRKLFENALPEPGFLKEVVLPNGIRANQFKAYQFGKGRILCVNYRADSMIPKLDFGVRWEADHENAFLSLMRGALWAANRDAADVSLAVEKNGNELKLKTSAPVRYRLRDEFNHIVKTGNAVQGAITLPALAGGRYYCDLFADGKNFGSHAFDVDSPVGKVTLNTSSDSIRNNGAFTGTLTLEKPYVKPMKAVLTLTDSPNKRIWERREIKIPAGASKVDFEFRNYVLPTVAGFLRAELSDAQGVPVAKADRELYFPKEKLDSYYQLVFGDPTTPIMSKQLADNLGFGLSLTHLNPQSARNLTLMNQLLVPYLTRVILGKSGKGEVTTMILSSKEREALKKLGTDHNFYRPEIQKLWRDQIHSRMDGLPKYGPILYSLGDENGVDLSSGYGPSDLASFREFLRKKYGTVAKLNQEWETSYSDFAQVPHRPLADSARDGRYPEWNDHHEYMEKMFADIHHFSADEIKKLDPRAKVGLEGTFGRHNLEEMMAKLDWWGPYTNPVEDEVLRSLYPDVPRFLWSGYHGERGEGKYPLIGEYLLKGSVNGNGWYGTGCDFAHDILAVDQSPSYPKMFLDELQRMRFGIAQLLIETPLQDSGIAVFWSHLSRRAPKVDARCVPPESGIGPLIRFCYQTGTGMEFVTGKTLNRLNKAKVLFLLGASSMNDKECAAVLNFVKNGGTVIADLSPAVLNEYLRKRTQNPLAPLFGNLTLQKDGKFDIRPLNTPKFKASKAFLNPDGKLFAETKYGKGKAILLNFNFPIVETAADPATPLSGLLKNMLADAGVKFPYSANKEITMRIRNGKGFELIGLLGGKKDGVVSVTLPGKRYVYECGAGFAGNESTIKANFASGSPLRVYAAFTEPQKAPAIKLKSSVRSGENLPFSLKQIPEGRILLIQAFSPDGREQLARNTVLNTTTVRDFNFRFPYNAEKGVWRFVVTDITTGLKTEAKVNVP